MVKIDTSRIRGWDTFHNVFAEEFGFPKWYGRNMDAWIDCMESLDDLEAGMSSVSVQPSGVLVIQLEHVAEFATRCPDQYKALLECTAFVNYSRIEVGKRPVLTLAFHK
ncbi:MAG: barstar family protein [Phycisphaerae bacterium]|nr:barstar family protein [Phycisphaerae bacterium]